MSSEVEVKLLLEKGYSKTQLTEICRFLGITLWKDVSGLLRASKEDLSTEIVSAVSQEGVQEIFHRFPLSPEVVFIGHFFTAKRGRVTLEDGYNKLSVSLLKLAEKYPRDTKKTLKATFDYGGALDTEDVKEIFPRKHSVVRNLLEELVREGVMEHRYLGEGLTVYGIPEERMGLVAEYLKIRKAKRIEKPTTPLPEPTIRELEEEAAFVADSERDLEEYIRQLAERIDEIVKYGSEVTVESLEGYLKNLLGEGLHFDGLLSLTQQLGLSETQVMGEGGESGLRTGFNLALFGDPGTGKSFSTRDLILGSSRLNIPPHGIPGINRYAGGMTAARFIRIGQAYEGRTFNFIIPEFNDWFRWAGMVEPLKLAMEGGTIKYEMHREVIGPYRLTSYFVVNYNTRVEEKGYSTTVRDPNFAAIEDRMLCRLHRMTKERYVEIAKNQMRLLRGHVPGIEEADKIRNLLTVIYAVQKGRGELGKKLEPRRILMSDEDAERFVEAREAIVDAVPGRKLRFSARIERNALVLASSLSLLNYFKFDETLPIDEKALSLAIRFYVEEASIREGERFSPNDIIKKLGL